MYNNHEKNYYAEISQWVGVDFIFELTTQHR